MNYLQCSMARTILEISVRELAKLAKVSTDTIVRLERGDELKERTVDAVRAVIEGSGLVSLEYEHATLAVPLAALPAARDVWKKKMGLAGKRDTSNPPASSSLKRMAKGRASD
jgi:hypothetical protein